MTLRQTRARALARATVFAALALTSGSCVVGPNYVRPAATPIPETYAEGWKVATPSAQLPRGAWWEMFEDPELDRLERMAGDANQELTAAAARFAQARATADVARAGLYPRVGASGSSTWQHDSLNRPVGGKPGLTYDSYTVAFDASWEIDVWGRVQRRVEAASAQEQAARADLASVQLALQSEVAADYFTIRALDAEAIVLEASVEVFRRSLELTRNRRAGGVAPDLDIAQAETVLATAEAALVDSELLRARFAHALATLVGEPASLFTLPRRPLDVAPVAVPPGLPAELLERRPDVSAAERRMAAANATIGAAEATFFPAIRLTGLGGLLSGDLASLLEWPSRAWALGPSVSVPLFQGGELRANLRGAKAAYEESVARYRQTVLDAFQEVEDALSAQRLLALEHEHTADAVRSARKAVELADNRYRAGLVTYLQVATAETIALDRERAAVRLWGQRFVTGVALVKSLGGGWQGVEAGGDAGPSAPSQNSSRSGYEGGGTPRRASGYPHGRMLTRSHHEEEGP